jgi:outer membrane protein assembly factor BamB
VKTDGNLLWKFRTHGVTECPAFWKDNIYFGSFDEFYRCIDSNGGLLWRFKAQNAIQYYTQSTISNGVVYAASRDHNLYALAAEDGKLLWKFRTFDMNTTQPKVYNGIVYFASADHNVYALDAESGKLVWKYKTEGQVFSPPASDGKSILFGSWDCHMYSVDAKDGTLLWKSRTTGQPSPVHADIAAPNEIVRITWTTRESGETEKTVEKIEKRNKYGKFSSDYTGASDEEEGSLDHYVSERKYGR